MVGYIIQVGLRKGGVFMSHREEKIEFLVNTANYEEDELVQLDDDQLESLMQDWLSKHD